MSTNKPMTQERLDEIRARLAAATDGPWSVVYESEECPPFKPYAYAIHGPTMQGVLESQVSDDFKAQYGHQMDEVTGVADDDAELIAHAPTDLAALLAELDRLCDELAKARAVTEDKVEVACKAYYEARAGELDDTICPRWDRLLAVSPDICGVYRTHQRAALTAALGGGDDA